MIESDELQVVPIPDLIDGYAELIIEDDTTLLFGSRCLQCHGVDFPARAVCHRCGVAGQKRHPVGSGGTLYSWTKVHVSSTREVPYYLGYVDVVDGLRVLGRLTGSNDWQLDEHVTVITTDLGWAFARTGSTS